jgi:hypothetical protein
MTPTLNNKNIYNDTYLRQFLVISLLKMNVGVSYGRKGNARSTNMNYWILQKMLLVKKELSISTVLHVSGHYKN